MLSRFLVSNCGLKHAKFLKWEISRKLTKYSVLPWSGNKSLLIYIMIENIHKIFIFDYVMIENIHKIKDKDKSL